jgi:hypothetical protein
MLQNFKDEVIEYARQGAPHVTEEQYKKRLETCTACEHLEDLRCGLCGCVVKEKSKWETANCPDSRWDKIVVGERGKKINLNGRKNDNTDTGE